ncbi:hypothetical protein H6G00_01475 [Leptolyngbya sp. FACHB-541]|uniref:hypothetical protein n=1 Tax=Leptolyngbya sp. FACHB-541 TaxID=2692810 RepID=UPI001683B540|nr:hypothetical protein [Leptolyngbya sp. FACHB-541]MBD1995300.1 hypothetical protein [Leptolyngbya sp. FACHB-541]
MSIFNQEVNQAEKQAEPAIAPLSDADVERIAERVVAKLIECDAFETEPIKLTEEDYEKIAEAIAPLIKQKTTRTQQS